MNERLKRIQDRITAFWGKYNGKQKTMMVSITLAVILFVIILAVALTRPTYQTLITVSSTTEAATVADVLTSAQIEYRTSTDGLVFSVRDSDVSAANIELGANAIPASGYSLDDALSSSGFSATAADKEKKYKAYLEDRIKSILDKLEYVSSSTVTLEMPDANYSVLESDEDTSVSVTLDLKTDPGEDKIEGLANYLATAVGSSSTSNITIIDSQSNLLFKGEDQDGNSGYGNLNTQNDLVELRNSQVIDNITKLLDVDGYGYSSVNVSPHLDINFDKVSSVSTEYDTGEREEGPLGTSYTVTEEGSSGTDGVVGTDGNDEDVTTYEITDGEGSTSTYELIQNEYKVNETVTTTETAAGTIVYENSSVAIVLNKDVTYSEEDEEAKGTLDGTTWAEFKAENATPVEIEVDDQMAELIAFATGFEQSAISIKAYEVPHFQDASADTGDIADYLAIILAVLILGLLGFVVWRSLRPVEVTETEPELSVEALLSSTKAAQNIEEIDLNDKSETRLAIEKFVDENPEAVALLLRNWLNEDWG